MCSEYFSVNNALLYGASWEESVLNTAESHTVRLLTVVDKQWAHPTSSQMNQWLTRRPTHSGAFLSQRPKASGWSVRGEHVPGCTPCVPPVSGWSVQRWQSQVVLSHSDIKQPQADRTLVYSLTFSSSNHSICKLLINKSRLVLKWKNIHDVQTNKRNASLTNHCFPFPSTLQMCHGQLKEPVIYTYFPKGFINPWKDF